MALVATRGFNPATVWSRHKMPLDNFSRTEVLGLMQSTDPSISMHLKVKCSATEKAVQKSFEESFSEISGHVVYHLSTDTVFRNTYSSQKQLLATFTITLLLLRS